MKRGWFLPIVTVLGFAFLYAPIVSLVVFSFNESRLVTVWGGFSTQWYGALLDDGQMLAAAWVSLKVGTISATLATVLGTLAAFVLTRFEVFRGKLLLTGMITAPLVEARGHHRQLRLHGVEHPHQIDLDQVAGEFRVGVGKALHRLHDAGVVDRDVKRAELGLRQIHQVVMVFRVANIAGQQRQFAIQTVGDRLQGGGVAVGQDQIGAKLGEAFRHAAAETAGGAAHQNRLAVKPHVAPPFEFQAART